MKTSLETTTYHLVHKEGIDVKLEERDLRTLLDKHFPDRSVLYEKIEKIVWKNESTLCIYDPVRGTVKNEIRDGDVNPYGWRLKHS